MTAVRLAAACAAATVLALTGGARAGAQSEDPSQCTPFATADDPAGQLASLRARLLPLLTGKPAAQALYSAYLTPGTASGDRVEVTDAAARAEFRSAAPTLAARGMLLAEAMTRVGTTRPKLGSPRKPTTRRISRHLGIDYPLGYDVPGLIAGGTGSVEDAAGTFTDDRVLKGRYRLVPRATRRGVLQGVTLVLKLDLTVLDSIDFCPGGLGGTPGQALGTLTMSRLERTPHGSGTYATPILFRVRTPLDPVTAAVDGYPGNDRDGDGIPERQPWKGARFKLDKRPPGGPPEAAGTAVGSRPEGRPPQPSLAVVAPPDRPDG